MCIYRNYIIQKYSPAEGLMFSLFKFYCLFWCNKRVKGSKCNRIAYLCYFFLWMQTINLICFQDKFNDWSSCPCLETFKVSTHEKICRMLASVLYGSRLKLIKLEEALFARCSHGMWKWPKSKDLWLTVHLFKLQVEENRN